MKKQLFLLASLLITGAINAQTVFINEIHYDNYGPDVDEGVEIAGPAGTDLSNYAIYLYNGNGGTVYGNNPEPLSGTITDQSGCGYGTLWFPIASMQNGAPDGLALVENGTNVIQFLSYEGTMLATDGPAATLSSTDIGVAGPGGVDSTLQLIGSGTNYTDFSWTGPIDQTRGAINTGQNFCTAPSPSVSFASSSATYNESEGTINIALNIIPATSSDETFEVTINDVSATYGVDYTTNPSGLSPFTVNVPTGVGSVSFELILDDDIILESAEELTFSITNTSSGLSLGGVTSMDVTITDNDEAIVPIATVQATTNGDQSDMVGNSVKVTGIVSAVKASNGFYIQDAAAAWSGIYVYDAGANTVSRGDSVVLTGTVAEFDFSGASSESSTQITNVTFFSNIGASTPYTSIPLTTASLNDEMYESVLVDITEGTTTTVPNGFGEWGINDGAGDALVDDFLYVVTPTPVVGNVYNITGVIGHSFSNYKLLPRDAADVVLVSGVGIDEVQEAQVVIYPNPSNGVVNFKNKGTALATIYNSLGQVVATTTANSINLESGVYLIKIGNAVSRVVVK